MKKGRTIKKYQLGDNVVSHKMAAETPDGENWFAFPTVDYNPATESWIKFDDSWDAYEYHKKNNSLLPIPSKDLALYYAQEGLIKHNNLHPNLEYNIMSNVLNQRNNKINWIDRGLNPDKYPMLTEDEYNNLSDNSELMKKKRKTIKYKDNSIMDYQYGGAANFDIFNAMNTKWSNFWKKGGNAGDYFKVKPDPYTYDPTKPTVNDPWGGNELARTVAMNNSILGSYTNSYNAVKNHSGYKGDDKIAAYDFYTNQKDTIFKDKLDSFGKYKTNQELFDTGSVKIGYDNNNNPYQYTLDNDGNQVPWNAIERPEGYDDYHNFDANKQWAKDKSLYKANQDALVNSKKELGNAFTNTATGIFSGLNYLNAYKPEKEVVLQDGFQGMQYAQLGLETSPTMGISGPEGSRVIPAAPIAPITTQYQQNNPVDIVKYLNSKGYQFPQNFTSQPKDKQTALIDAYIEDYRIKLKKENKGKSGKLVKQITTPLSAEVITSEGDLKAQQNAWYAEQKRLGRYGTIQYFNGNAIKIEDDPNYKTKGTFMTSVEKGLAKDVYNKKEGGSVNFTGYTQGSPTANNKINIIPDGRGTMDGVSQDLIAFGIEGADKGRIKRLSKGSGDFMFKGAFAELPINKPEQQPDVQYAQTGASVKKPATYVRPLWAAEPAYTAAMQKQAANAAYLQSLSPDDTNPSGYNESTGMGITPTAAVTPTSVSTSNTPTKPSTVYKLKHDSVYDYTQDANGNWLSRRKTSKGDWVDMKTRLSDDDYKKAVGLIEAGKYTEAKTPSGATRTSKKVGTSPTASIHALMPMAEDSAIVKTSAQPSFQSYNNPDAFSFLNNIPQNNTPQGVLAPQFQGGAREVQSNSPGFFNSNLFKVNSVDFDILPEEGAKEKKLTEILSGIDTKRNALKTKASALAKQIQSKVVKGYGGADWNLDWRLELEKELSQVNEEIKSLDTSYNNFKNKPSTRKKWKEEGGKRWGKPVTAKASRVLNQLGLYSYGGSIPKYQFGGEINNDYAYPIHPITEEFTDIQTEKGEVATLPDGTIVDVKATEKHKDMDKNHITDILPGKSHVFSHDPKMKLNLDSSIGGVKIKDMKLGKTTFEYKENQVTVGPKDIMLSEIWGDKKELTPAELVNNVKKKFELRDNKNNFLTQRANEENKEQRLLYIDVIKAFSEYKKPKTKREAPEAQYGMQLSTMNVGLPNVYNQPTNTAIDGMLGYNNKALDPYSNMDNTMKSMYNVSSVVSPKLYEDGGDIPHAQLGKLMRYTTPGFYLASEFFANRAKTKQERENEILNAERTKYANDMQNTVDTSGRIGIGTNLATYMAGLNVPRQLYDDQSEQLALVNDHFRRRNADLQAQKYSQLNSLGSAGSLARYTNPNNMGQYLAASQQGYNQNVGAINSQIGSLEDQKVQNIMNLLSKRNEGYNASENAFRNQLYNVNVQGIGNTGRSLQEATLNSGDTRYRLGMEKMAYDQYLKEKAQAARDKVIGDWEGSLDVAGQLGITALTGGFGNLAGLGGSGGSGVNAQQQNMININRNNTGRLAMQNTLLNNRTQLDRYLPQILPLPIFGN